MKIDEIEVTQEGVFLTWDNIEKMISNMKQRSLDKPEKESYYKGKADCYEGLLSYREDIEKIPMKEIKMSGFVGTLTSDNELRRIVCDCGGIISVRDFILCDCGKYAIGDRVTVSIAPCSKEEYHYPPKP